MAGEQPGALIAVTGLAGVEDLPMPGGCPGARPVTDVQSPVALGMVEQPVTMNVRPSNLRSILTLSIAQTIVRPELPEVLSDGFVIARDERGGMCRRSPLMAPQSSASRAARPVGCRCATGCPS